MINIQSLSTFHIVDINICAMQLAKCTMYYAYGPIATTIANKVENELE